MMTRHRGETNDAMPGNESRGSRSKKARIAGESELFGQPIMLPGKVQRIVLAAVMVVCLVSDCYPAAIGLTGDQAPTLAWLIFSIYAIAVLLLPIIPQWSCIAVIIITAITIPLPWTHLEDLTFGGALAFAVLYYCLPTWCGLAVQALFTAEYTVYHVFWGRGAAFAIIGLILQISLSIIGYTFRRQRLNEQAKHNAELLKQTQNTIQRTERDLLLARNLHDTLTNDLARISMISVTLLLDCKDPEQRRMLQSIDDTTREATECAHHVIDVLRNTGGQLPPSTLGTWQDKLDELIRRLRKDLTAHGYHGSAIFHSEDVNLAISDGTYDELASLTCELFANIEHHCPNGGDFSIDYRTAHGTLTIVQANTTGDAEVTEDAGAVTDAKDSNGCVHRINGHANSGRGLALHRRIIESMGGSIHYSTEEGIWMLRATIPLTAA